MWPPHRAGAPGLTVATTLQWHSGGATLTALGSRWRDPTAGFGEVVGEPKGADVTRVTPGTAAPRCQPSVMALCSCRAGAPGDPVCPRPPPHRDVTPMHTHTPLPTPVQPCLGTFSTSWQGHSRHLPTSAPRGSRTKCPEMEAASRPAANCPGPRGMRAESALSLPGMLHSLAPAG